MWQLAGPLWCCVLPHCLANAPIPILLNAHIHLFNAKCELELAEDHDKMVVDLCSKHGQSRDELEEKIDSLQKANAKLEQEKASLSTENADLVRQVHKLEKDASLKGKHREGAAVALDTLPFSTRWWPGEGEPGADETAGPASAGNWVQAGRQGHHDRGPEVRPVGWWEMGGVEKAIRRN